MKKKHEKNSDPSIVTSLIHKFLIATPNLQDPFFKQSVIYLCEHDDEGAVGLIINHPIRCPLGFVFEQMEIAVKVPELSEKSLMIGGPIHQEHGFVIHQDTGKKWRSSLKMPHGLCITTSQDILKAMAEGTAPKDTLFILGYSAWEAGQIEKELKEDNVWLVYESEDNSLLFDVPVEKRWKTALERMGISKHQFLMGAGNA
jgi:putative transcriptional regulator